MESLSILQYLLSCQHNNEQAGSEIWGYLTPGPKKEYGDNQIDISHHWKN